MAKTYVWHNPNTAESAAAIASALECEHGTVPPQGFEGDVINYGGSPAENFKWGARKFAKVINDPRKFKKYADKAQVQQKLAASYGYQARVFVVGGEVVKAVKLADNSTIVIPASTRTALAAMVVALDNPDIVTFEVILNSTNHALASVTNVVFAAAITDHPDVVEAIKSKYGDVDDKSALQKLIDGSTPAELKALRKILKSL